jgi:hypothetical protein
MLDLRPEQFSDMFSTHSFAATAKKSPSIAWMGGAELKPAVIRRCERQRIGKHRTRCGALRHGEGLKSLKTLQRLRCPADILRSGLESLHGRRLRLFWPPLQKRIDKRSEDKWLGASTNPPLFP